jgi:hypothetical protein
MTQNIAQISSSQLTLNIFDYNEDCCQELQNMLLMKEALMYEKPVLFSYIAASIILSAGADKVTGEKLYSHRLW